MPGDVLGADHRDQPIGRLETGNAAERRRPDHRARRLRTERDRHHAGGDTRRGTRRRAARRVVQIVRIARHRRHQRSHFGRHRLADDDAAGAARQCHRAGVGARPKTGIDQRAILRRQVAGIVNVLEGDRQATKRRCGKPWMLGGTTRRLEVEHHEGGDILLARFDRPRAQIDRGARREVAGLKAADKIKCGQHRFSPAGFSRCDVAPKAVPDQASWLIAG